MQYNIMYYRNCQYGHSVLKQTNKLKKYVKFLLKKWTLWSRVENFFELVFCIALLSDIETSQLPLPCSLDILSSHSLFYWSTRRRNGILCSRRRIELLTLFWNTTATITTPNSFYDCLPVETTSKRIKRRVDG